MCGPHDNTNVTHVALGGPSVWHVWCRASSVITCAAPLMQIGCNAIHQEVNGLRKKLNLGWACWPFRRPCRRREGGWSDMTLLYITRRLQEDCTSKRNYRQFEFDCSSWRLSRYSSVVFIGENICTSKASFSNVINWEKTSFHYLGSNKLSSV